MSGISVIFRGQTYAALPQLAGAMGRYWAEGKDFLLSGSLREAVKGTDRSLAAACVWAEREARNRPDLGNVIFLGWLYRHGRAPGLYWQGQSWGEYPQVRGQIAAGPDPVLAQLLRLMLSERLLGEFMAASGANPAVIERVRVLERLCGTAATKKRQDQLMAELPILLRDEAPLEVDGREFRTLPELAAYLQPFADQSRAKIAAKARLLLPGGELTPEFEAWLIRLGEGRTLTWWRARFRDEQDEGEAPAAVDPSFLENHVQQQAAAEENEEDFAREAQGMEEAFIAMLRDHAGAAEDPQAFEGLLRDYFPDRRVQVWLLAALGKMDIRRALREEEITPQLAFRFEKRLTQDFGVRDSFARWAVAFWCRCYGEEVLGRPNLVPPPGE